MALVRLIIAGDVHTVALAVQTVLHNGLIDRHGTVKEAFELSGERVVVQREAPHHEVGGDVLLDGLGHIVVAEALSGGALPAVQASQTGLDVHF
jgi:hypothetical protein